MGLGVSCYDYCQFLSGRQGTSAPAFNPSSTDRVDVSQFIWGARHPVCPCLTLSYQQCLSLSRLYSEGGVT
jgi:hypothetical protein